MVEKLNAKRGNILVISMFVVIILLLIIISYIFITYTCLLSDIMALKTDLFYICQNALLSLNYNDFALNKYTIDYEMLQKNINNLLYLNYTFSKTNFKSIRITQLNIINDSESAKFHTNSRYDVPILHINVEIIYNYVITNKEKEFNVHEDIKLTQLTVGDING